MTKLALGDRLRHLDKSSWVWLLACMKELELPEVQALHHFDDITRSCAADIPALVGITAAAPRGSSASRVGAMTLLVSTVLGIRFDPE